MISEDILALRARFKSMWDAAIQTVHENAPAVDLDPTKPWVRFSINPGTSSHYLGGANNGRQLQVGRVYLQIFLPLQDGDGEGYEIADTFADIFRNWRSSDGFVTCATAQTNPLGQVDDWYAISVSVPYNSCRPY